MSFLRHARPVLHSIKRLVDITTLISPTQGGYHKPSSGAATTDEAPNTPFLALGESTVAHLRLLYRELCGRSSLLSRDRFAAFLAGSQGETVLPLDKEKYRFEEFLEVWSFRYNWDAFRPVTQEKDLTRSLANYFISSSHNTYLLGNQLSSEASADAYRKVSKPRVPSPLSDPFRALTVSPRPSARTAGA